MKKIFLFIILTSVITIFASGLITIEKAKSFKDLKVVTVKGIVTVEPGPFDINIFFIQDKTAGINVYGRGWDFLKLGIKRGDLVKVTGYMWTHKMNREIVLEKDSSYSKIEILKRGNKLPEPLKISTNQINDEKLEGLLVKTKGKIVRIDKTDIRKIFIDDGSGEGMVFIRENTGIDTGIFKEGIEIEVVGVLGQYLSAHELWPRSIEDIKAQDIFPPKVLDVSIINEKNIYVLFNEPIDEKSILPNKTVKVLKNNILAFNLHRKNRILSISLNQPLKQKTKIFFRKISDLKNNKLNLFAKTLDITKDSSMNHILFDNAHGQTAGNADWTIKGGYSDFHDELLKIGYKVNEIKNEIDTHILKMYGVYVIPEPNKPFTSKEIDAILNYVKNGGNLFLIADHGGADRNGNGWDAVRIFNQFVEKFGFKFVGDDLEEAPVKYVFEHKITKDIKKIGIWNGSSIEIIDDKNVKILLATSEKKAYMVISHYGKGKIVAIGDSSPFDDGSGEAGKILYDGWSWGDDAKLAVNVIRFLSGR